MIMPRFSARTLAALVTVQVLFGIHYVVSKAVIAVFPPLVWANLRALASAALLFPVVYATRRKTMPKLNADFFKPLAVLSLSGIMINQSSFLIGLKHTTATNSAILNTLIPIFTLLFVTLSGQEAFSFKKAVGFAFALSGVLFLRGVEHLSFSDQTLAGDLMIIINAVSYGYFLASGKEFLQKHDAIWVTAWLFLLGSVGIGVIAIPSWVGFEWPAIDFKLGAAMAFAVVGSSLLAYLLNIWALGRTRSSSVALFAYLQPVVASILAWIWLDETPTARLAISSILIFVGVLIAVGPSLISRTAKAPLT
jgi:drug/metabolite transporter (DMT)-like permease